MKKQNVLILFIFVVITILGGCGLSKTNSSKVNSEQVKQPDYKIETENKEENKKSESSTEIKVADDKTIKAVTSDLSKKEAPKDIDESSEQVCKKYKLQLYNIPDYKKWGSNIVSSEKSINEDFKKYFTDSGFGLFTAMRQAVSYRIAALQGKYTMQLKSIDLKKSYENNKDEMMGFDYTADITIKFSESNIEKVVKECGFINLKKENGKWRLLVDKVSLPLRASEKE